MKYPKLENIKSRDDSDSWQVGFGQGLRPKDAPAAWTAAILSRWLAFVAANPSLRYSRSGGPCFHCGEPRKRYYGYNSRWFNAVAPRGGSTTPFTSAPRAHAGRPAFSRCPSHTTPTARG